MAAASAPASYRELTDLHAIQALLAETVAAEALLDAEIEALLDKRTELADVLGGLDAAGEVLEIVQADAQHVAASVEGTCVLAERVSGKVRELDRAQSRVAETVVRIDAICERSGALGAACASLAAEDFETAADAVQRYLALDSKYPGLSPCGDEHAGEAAEQHRTLLATKARLEEAVRSRFSAAVGSRRHEDVLRYSALFPKLGLQGEGAAQLIAYLRASVAARARADAEALSDALHAPAPAAPAVVGPEAPTFASCLCGLFKDIALAVEEQEELLSGCFGADSLLRCLSELHAEADLRASQLLKRFSDHHSLPRLAQACARRGGGASSASSASAAASEQLPDPRTVEGHLEEALLLCCHCEEYSAFMLTKLRSVNAQPPAMQAFRAGAFSRAVLELVGHYIQLEEYFMVENVVKAIRIDEHSPGQLTSSLVDDVFYILLKCGRRSGLTGSVQCTCAVLNHVANLLSGEVRDALTQRLRGAPGRLLSALQAATPGEGAASAAACLNNTDVSADYVVKLRGQLEEHAVSLYTESPADCERIRSCLADLQDTSAALRKAAQAGAQELAQGLQPRLRPLVDAAGVARYELSDAEYGAQEGEPDPWALRLLTGAEACLAPLQPLLSPALFDALVQHCLDSLVQRLEAVLWQRRFNALGALALDRDLRTLVGGLSGLAPRTVRDKFARLTQIASCLGLEAPEEILDYWGDNAGAVTWRLQPAEVRRALGLRLEFRQEAIVSLRL